DLLSSFVSESDFFFNLPAFFKFSCNSHSICPLTLRKSSAAHLESASKASCSNRKTKFFLFTKSILFLLINAAGIDYRLRIFVAAKHEHQVTHHLSFPLFIQRDDFLIRQCF